MVNQTSNNHSAAAPTPASQGAQPAAPNQREETIRKKICSWDQCQRENPKMVCGRCKLVCYCDKKCQKSHWAFHKAICKEPEETNIHVKVTSGISGQVTSKTVPVDIHQQEDTHRPHTRPTGVSKKSVGKNIGGLEGNNIQLTQENDVVAYSQKYFDRSTITALKEKGYKGLKQTDRQKLAELLSEQKYIEILKHVWTEDDVAFKLNWLKEYASKGHVILMFETCRAMCLLKEHTEETILEAFKWRTLGRIHTYIDAACHEDRSVEAAGSFLKECYPLDHLIPREQFRQYADKIQQQNKVIFEVRLLDSDPSPKWLMYHGLESFMGKNTLVPQDQWLRLRMAKLKLLMLDVTG